MAPNGKHVLHGIPVNEPGNLGNIDPNGLSYKNPKEEMFNILEC